MTRGLADAVLVRDAAQLPYLAVRYRVTLEDLAAWTPDGMARLEAGEAVWFRLKPPERSAAVVAGRGQQSATAGDTPAPAEPVARPAPSPAPELAALKTSMARDDFLARTQRAFGGCR